MRFGLVVPTRAGGAALLRMAPLPAGTRSVLSQEGDFRPLAGSARCADLTAPAGPIARAIGAAPAACDFVFDRAPDADRAWEAAIVFALLAARSEAADLVAPDAADVVVVVHGSVDADLALGTDGVGAPDRVSVSRWREPAPAAGRRFVRLGLGAGANGSDETAAAPLRLDRETVERSLAFDTGARSARRRPPLSVILGLGVTVTVVAGLVVAVATLRPRAPMPPHPEGSQASPATAGGPAGSGEVTPAPLPPPPASPEAFRVRLLAAPAGRRCEEVIFGAVAPLETPLAATGSVLDLTGRGDVCGLDVAARTAGRRVELRGPPKIRLGTVDGLTETIDGETTTWLRVLFGRGARQASGFDVVVAADGSAPVATLSVRPPAAGGAH